MAGVSSTGKPDFEEKPVVVLVDDDHGCRLAVSAVLEPIANVIAFETGDAALKHLLDQPSCAAVILDVHLGSLGGFDIARLLRERQRTREIPIIFLTGAEASVADGYAEGAFDFITKPFEPEALRGKVAALVRLDLQRRALERERDASRRGEHAAREETAAQRRYLLEFLAQMSGLVAQLRGPTHIFEFANAGYAAVIEEDDPIGKPLGEVVPEALARELLPILDEVYRTGIGASLPEVAVRSRDRIPRTSYFNFSYQPIRAISGAIEGIFLQGVDVSDLVAARQKVEALSLELRTSAEEAGRLSTLQQQLLAIVGHDLRNPLQAIAANARLLQLQPGDPKVAAAVVPRITRSALRMNQLISDLVAFTQARLTGGIKVTRETCNIADICKQIIEELAAVHPERTIEMETSANITGEWDCARLQQVISNLVANGLQYSPRDARLLVRVEDRSSEVLLHVQNEGPPIPADVLGSLFEPFKRGPAEPQSGNMGLGLFIVDQVVRAHGGSVEVSSTEEDGTIFTVHLPRAA